MAYGCDEHDDDGDGDGDDEHLFVVIMSIKTFRGQAYLRFLGAKLKSNMQKGLAREYTPP
jgi:hypothetical protein